jgi:hypothetical protein
MLVAPIGLPCPYIAGGKAFSTAFMAIGCFDLAFMIAPFEHFH